MEEHVLRLFKWELMQYVAQPFTTEYQFFVAMDRSMFEDETFNAQRILIYMWFRKYLHRRIRQRRLFFSTME